MIEVFNYPFMQRAILAGIFSAGLLGYLGSFITTRKMSFLGDGIAHASLAGVAIALFFGWAPLPVAILFSAIIAVFIYFLENKANISSDSAIGIIFTSGMAVGILVLSFYPGYQPELITYLFGNILTINQANLFTIIFVSFFIFIFLLINYRKMVFITFDRNGAYLSGISVWKQDLLLYIFSAISIVVSIKLVGIILVSALLVIPSSIARIFAKSFKLFVLISFLTSIVLVFFGLLISYSLDLPSGATIIIFSTLIFALSSLFKKALNYFK
ncbi:manganese transporter [Candidatus Parcubacteria bacterium]|nr:MAG: manganese transporter [Candidatus Parcubacteria bacterium]